MTTQPITNVTTGKVRLSFVHLVQPYAREGQEARYSTTILIPKSDAATKTRIDAAIAAAAQEGVSAKWNGSRPPALKTPVWDGDGVRQNGEPFGPECKGCWVLTASSKQKQDVVDENLNPILDSTAIYSGMYARVNMTFFPFSNSGNRGIGCGLGPVQKVADGEPLGGRVSAEQAFGGAPAMTQGQPTYAPQPQPTYAPQGQPTYAPPQYNPITGQPLNGPIMGL